MTTDSGQRTPTAGAQEGEAGPGAGLRVGTRASRLALAQTQWVAELLTAASGAEVSVTSLSTEGDRSSAPIAQLGRTGVFVNTLRTALVRGEVDFVVHSFKDLPTAPDSRLFLAAVPVREDPRDALVHRERDAALDTLPAGSRVGTGSPRRAAQLLAYRPDLRVTGIRGNVDTRLRKITEGTVDAVVLAMAGLSRVRSLDVVSQPLPPSALLPAPAQGALAVECRADDTGTAELLAAIDDETCRAQTAAERAFLAALDAGCTAPVAALATTDGTGEGGVRLAGLVAAPDGGTVLRGEHRGPAAESEETGRRLADELIRRGARELLATGTAA